MFSVIIPLYNKEKYIEKAIQSVLYQTFQDFELIIVNDGSTDNSLGIIQRFSHKKIRAINQENAGVSVARNNGVRAAKYKYIAFLDADDWWEPAFLEEMHSLINCFPQNGIWCCAHFNFKNGISKECKIQGIPIGFIKGEIDYASIAKYGNKPICVGSVIVNKRIHLEEGGFKSNLKLGEDFDLFFRIATKYGMVLLNKPLNHYNNDVDINSRAAGMRLYKKQEHFAFNLNSTYFDYSDNAKYLINSVKLRSYILYYIKGLYINEIKQDLRGVKWSDYDWRYYFQYNVIPRKIIWFYYFLKYYGSLIKQKISR